METLHTHEPIDIRSENVHYWDEQRLNAQRVAVAMQAKRAETLANGDLPRGVTLDDWMDASQAAIDRVQANADFLLVEILWVLS